MHTRQTGKWELSLGYASNLMQGNVNSYFYMSCLVMAGLYEYCEVCSLYIL